MATKYYIPLLERPYTNLPADVINSIVADLARYLNSRPACRSTFNWTLSDAYKIRPEAPQLILKVEVEESLLKWIEAIETIRQCRIYVSQVHRSRACKPRQVVAGIPETQIIRDLILENPSLRAKNLFAMFLEILSEGGVSPERIQNLKAQTFAQRVSRERRQMRA